MSRDEGLGPTAFGDLTPEQLAEAKRISKLPKRERIEAAREHARRRRRELGVVDD